MEDTMLDELRDGLEVVVNQIREVRQAPAQREGLPWVKMEHSDEGPTSRFDVVQTYLLVKILDKLDTIEKSLLSR